MMEMVLDIEGEEFININKAMPLTYEGKVIALQPLIENSGLKPEDIDYVLETSEEACGDSPPQVYKSLVADPLTKGGYKIKDIDRYASELVNPEIIESTGCGDVAKMN